MISFAHARYAVMLRIALLALIRTTNLETAFNIAWSRAGEIHSSTSQVPTAMARPETRYANG